MSRGDVLVAGGGITGLYAALLLARRGRRVRVLERAPVPGGLAGLESFRGLPCDLGSHRLHPSALSRPLFRELDRVEPLLVRPRRGWLLLGDARVPYPPAAWSLLRALGLRTSLSFGLGYLSRGTRRRRFESWDRERAVGGEEGDVGFERFVLERVGSSLYQAFYRPYAEKVWGLDPALLSQTVAKRRVSTTRPAQLVRGAAARLLAPGSSATSAGGATYLYPRGGISSVIRYLLARLAEHRVEVQCDGVYRPGEGSRGEQVLFTGRLADLVATRLEHRGLYLLYLSFGDERPGHAETYYAPDQAYWFGRVSELGNYSPDLRRPGERVLCVEIPEGRWGRGIDFASGARLDALVAQLERARIVRRGAALLEARQRFLPDVYPLYRRGWLAEWRRTMAEVARARTALPVGRQGLFLHCNLDHCADIARDAVEHVLAGGDARTWVRRAERYLELTVRD